MSGHTVNSFDVELQAINSKVADLGIQVEQQLADAMRALERGDQALAQGVRDRDVQLDRIAEQIEHDAIQLIAKRQPMAVDLRHVMAALRIASNLERAGDLARNISKRTLAVTPVRTPEELANRLNRMAELALFQLRETREAFAARDTDRAQRVWEHDTTIDELHTLLFRDIVQLMSEDTTRTLDLAHLLFIAKNVERVGDHATNIAENVVYLVTGAGPSEDRPKHDESSTISRLLPHL